MILLCLLLALVESLKTEIPALTESHHEGDLGFANWTTEFGVTPAMITNFKNFIQSSTSFYPYDTNASMGYISDQMNKLHGSDGNGFSVLLMTNDTSFSWSISTQDVFASVAPGVDLQYPKSSYMFVRDIVYSEGRSFFIYMDQQGSGITQLLW